MVKANVGAYITNTEFPVADQKKKLETWASENNARIVDFYVDEDTQSSRVEERSAFKKLMGDIDSHKVDSILSVDYDRLSDEKGDLYSTLSDLQDKGVRIYSISDTIRG